ncbi:peptide/nickel transport system permease protein [Roseibium hamelinense]|uniref:Peptide/nickel transport system permease protein n=1 Tax=Roseibium hamelinense TaxID=150831 RepID=A0A562SVM2_9HYPH|nr:dipeptide/oligopeptide/nickel ABC transporter permease/ATP-binding protein [Roseibium hamelinense]MTI43181.1 dipeptide/oligopeptide/nickel ABC transporter permease/ATP-binding protein [Roseibium hamelinense]TWI84770.1 peptide/nickel transport system permease protein [Roseibium hamelinense]
MAETTLSAPAKPAPNSNRPGTAALLLNNTLATSGLAVLLAICLIALAAPILPLPDPDVTAPANRLLPVFSEGHLLGTDHLGRDLLSRLIWGTRVSLAVGLSATAIAAFFGSLLGLVAGYAGGRTDAVIMRGIDMVMAFPYILLALAIVAVLGPGLLNALYAIALVNIPFFARNIRGITLGLSRREFVDAARLSGKSPVQILFLEILPNVLPVIVITMSTTIGWMILETAGLSFLGLGAQPPQADLGSMLGEGRKILFTAPHVSIIPGLMIFALVMSINLFGDGVRDILDPRLRAGSLTRPVSRTAVERDCTSVPQPSSEDGVLDVRGMRTEFQIGSSVYKAVGGVDLHLKQGECLGIVGESGSGKSVTAMSIMGLVPTPPGRISGGAAYLEGEDLFAASNRRIKDLRGGTVAYVFQDPLSTLHPLFTVGDQLKEAISTHQPLSGKALTDKAVELLTLVRIPNAKERLSAYPHELSGGMRQRVCIAMALANDAKVLIADEPTTALDVTVQSQVLTLMNGLRREKNTAVLFITHDFGVVSALCDRVAVMYAGKIVETGTTEDVLSNPRHPYTAKLIDCVPVLGQPERRVDAIEGRPPVVNNLPDGCAFAARCPRARAACRRGEIELEMTTGDSGVRCLFPLGKGEDA